MRSSRYRRMRQPVKDGPFPGPCTSAEAPPRSDAAVGEAPAGSSANATPVGPAGGGDAGDPESPEVALPVAAVAIGVLLRPVHRFGRRAEQPALGPVVPFRQLESLLMSCAGLGPAFSPWHGSGLSFLERCSSVQ